MTLGPLDYTVIGFAGNRFKGEIAPEIAAIADAGIIRVVDLVFVTKDREGGVDIIELDNVDDEAFSGLAPLLKDLRGLLTPEDVAELATKLPNETSALIVLFENRWAERVKEAIVRAGGFLVAHERIQPEALEALNAELQETVPA
jgi:hypothetical protein